jgi:hypothetical protein
MSQRSYQRYIRKHKVNDRRVGKTNKFNQLAKRSQTKIPLSPLLSSLCLGSLLEAIKKMRTYKKHTCEQKKNCWTKLLPKLIQIMWFSSQRSRMEWLRCFKYWTRLSTDRKWKSMCQSVQQRETYMTRTDDGPISTMVFNSEEKRSRIWRQQNRWNISVHELQLEE